MKATLTLKTAAVILFLLHTAIYIKPACAQVPTSAQKDSTQQKRAQSIYAELLGPGLLLSINYDARFTKRRDGWGGRLGVGYLADRSSSLITIPLQLNYLIGQNTHFLELGLGATYINYNDDTDHDEAYFFSLDDLSVVFGTTTIGYRYQPVNSGFNFRGSINPLFNTHGIYPFLGISFGYTFK